MIFSVVYLLARRLLGCLMVLARREVSKDALGAAGYPDQSWVVQQARNLLMDLEDAGTRAKFVLHDRDASFTATFDSVFQVAGIWVIRSAVQAPRMNSVMERWIGSCRRELLDRTLVLNQRHLMIVLREYEDFYNRQRPAPNPERGRCPVRAGRPQTYPVILLQLAGRRPFAPPVGARSFWPVLARTRHAAGCTLLA